MKKFIFFFSLLLIGINVIKAEETSSVEENSPYLSELKIDNFKLSPEFDKYNNTYTINIDEDTTKLNIQYTLEDPQAEIEILNNELITEDESTVYINITNNDQKQTYRIIVNKNKNQTVANLDDTKLDLSVEKTYNLKLVLAGIIIAWLTIVFISKKILFTRKKIKR